MDELGLNTLRAELKEDCRVIQQAAQLARTRFGAGHDEQLEACAYQLARLYNVVEQMAVRVARAFENNIDDDQGWHMELLRRLSIEITGIRPVFFPPALTVDLQELKAFRHVVRHAYELVLQSRKLLPLLDSAQRVAQAMPVVCQEFCCAVAAARSWTLAI
jgi:hypothetical protein